MKRTILLLSLFAAVPAAGSSLSITAAADPPSALPGVPVSIVLKVENTSAVAQKLPKLFVLQVSRDGGKAFIPDGLGSPVKALASEYDEVSRTLGPRETRTYEIALGNNYLTAGPMADPRLWVPGNHVFRVFLHDELREGDVHALGLERLLAAGRVSTPLLVSSEATLHVEKPSGVDADIWAKILEMTEGRGLSRNRDDASDAIANELWAVAGHSAYMPYLVGYMRSVPRAQWEGIWQQVIERHPTHRVAEELRLARASSRALQARSSAVDGGDLQVLLRSADDARSELAELQKNARHDLIRIRARKELEKLKTREELIELHREARAKHPQTMQ